MRALFAGLLLAAGVCLAQGQPVPVGASTGNFTAKLSVPAESTAGLCLNYPTCNVGLFYVDASSHLQTNANFRAQGYLYIDSYFRTGSYLNLSGTPGNGTANTALGRAAIAAAGTAAVITNSLVDADDIVLVSTEDNDATCLRIKVVPASGSFTVTCNAAATATTKFVWFAIKN